MPVYFPTGTASKIYVNNTADQWIECSNITTGTISASAAAWTNPSDQVWHYWTTTAAATTTITINEPAWDAWVNEAAYQQTLQRRLDVQQADQLQQRREQHSREELAVAQQRRPDIATARSRAMELLNELLTEEERAVRDTEQRVAIRGSDGHLYWLEMHRQTVHGNIVRTDEHGCLLGRACVAPAMQTSMGALPTADGWVGQYLGLKFDAANFLSHANWSSVRRCRVAQAA